MFTITYLNVKGDDFSASYTNSHNVVNLRFKAATKAVGYGWLLRKVTLQLGMGNSEYRIRRIRIQNYPNPIGFG